MAIDENGADQQAPVLYSNTVHVEATVYDIGLMFGLLSEGAERQQVMVRMSPQHAKSLLLLLERFLGAFEREIGRIELPQKLIGTLKGEETGDASTPKSEQQSS